MRIGELGQECGVSPKTVRYYESIGLLATPSRAANGYREYDGTSVERLQFIRDAQATGLTLAEIASVLELKSAGQRSCAHTAALIEDHIASIDDQLTQLANARRELVSLSDRAQSLDPSVCTDPNRCQVIESGRESLS